MKLMGENQSTGGGAVPGPLCPPQPWQGLNAFGSHTYFLFE
jgi:hypothetical protein